MSNQKKYTSHFVLSEDGTHIHYRKMGAGEGLILVHGGMMYSENFMRLAELLADQFTVYTPDRWGRGLSERHSEYSLQKEADDILAIIDKTESRYIFGLSSGAVIVLQAALSDSELKKVAVYEPPLCTNKSEPYLTKMTKDYHSAIREQNYGKAFVGILRNTGDKGMFLKYIPGFILTPFMNTAIKKEAVKKTDTKVTLKSLIAAMEYDLQLVHQSGKIVNNLGSITADILLIGGEKSIFFLTDILDELETKLPKAQRIAFPNVGHTASENNGQPEEVAIKLKRFFQ